MLSNWIKESFTPAAGNGGNLNIALTEETGFVRFSTVFADNTPCYYAIVKASDGTPLEIGIGVFQSTNTLDRTLPLATYVSGTLDNTAPAKVSLTDGTKYFVICTQDAGALGNIGMQVPFLASGYTVAADAKCIPFANQSGYPTAAASTQQSANRLYLFPVLIAQRRQYNGFLVRTGTQGATPVIDMGLYSVNPSNGAPDVLIADSSNNTPSASTNQVFPFTAKVIDPGWYWLGVNSNGTSNQLQCNANTYYPGMIGSSRADINSEDGIYVASVTAGTLPNPAGTPANAVQGWSTTGSPFVMLRCAD